MVDLTVTHMQEGMTALCFVAGGEGSPYWSAQPVSRKRGEVTCSVCIEWMHA